ncbi:hypothetical protein H8959_019168 [Pygathrix nigripes]
MCKTKRPREQRMGCNGPRAVHVGHWGALGPVQFSASRLHPLPAWPALPRFSACEPEPEMERTVEAARLPGLKWKAVLPPLPQLSWSVSCARGGPWAGRPVLTSPHCGTGAHRAWEPLVDGAGPGLPTAVEGAPRPQLPSHRRSWLAHSYREFPPADPKSGWGRGQGCHSPAERLGQFRQRTCLTDLVP